MGDFFRVFREYGPFDGDVEFLDWLFDDNRFSSDVWTSARKRRLTKQIKKLDGFCDGRFRIKASKMSYPHPTSTQNRYKKPYAMFSQGKLGEAESFIRHIRNGIAHGNAQGYRANKTCFIEIRDYAPGEKKTQTAYIAMPIAYLKDIWDLAQRIEREAS